MYFDTLPYVLIAGWILAIRFSGTVGKWKENKKLMRIGLFIVSIAMFLRAVQIFTSPELLDVIFWAGLIECFWAVLVCALAAATTQKHVDENSGNEQDSAWFFALLAVMTLAFSIWLGIFSTTKFDAVVLGIPSVLLLALMVSDSDS